MYIRGLGVLFFVWLVGLSGMACRDMYIYLVVVNLLLLSQGNFVLNLLDFITSISFKKIEGEKKETETETEFILGIYMGYTICI